MQLPDAATMSARWQERQQKITDSLNILNQAAAAQGKQYVRNPMNASQLLTIDVPQSSAGVAAGAAASAATSYATSSATAQAKLNEPLATGDLSKYLSPTGDTPPPGTTMSDLAQGGKYSGQYSESPLVQPLSSADLSKYEDPNGNNPPPGTSLSDMAPNGKYAGQYNLTTTAFKTKKESLTTALSGLDTATENLVTAGGAKGLAGFFAKIPKLGQYFDPRGYAYEQTKPDLATQIAKAISGSSRPAAGLINQYINSLPDITDTPQSAQDKLNNIYTQLINQAHASNMQDILKLYPDYASKLPSSGISNPTGNQPQSTVQGSDIQGSKQSPQTSGFKVISSRPVGQ